MRLRSIALATFALLLGGMLFSTQAKHRQVFAESFDTPTPALSGTYESQVDATEMSSGNSQEMTNAVYGWNSYGKTTGGLCGHVFISVNYSVTDNNDSFMTPSIVPDNVVTGGSWSKIIYVDGVYAGSISGTIVGGSLVWDENHTTAQVELQLVGTKGADNFVGLTGVGTFSGTLDRTTSDATLTGTLRMKY